MLMLCYGVNRKIHPVHAAFTTGSFSDSNKYVVSI